MSQRAQIHLFQVTDDSFSLLDFAQQAQSLTSVWLKHRSLSFFSPSGAKLDQNLSFLVEQNSSLSFMSATLQMQLKVAAPCNIGSSDGLDGQPFPDYSSASINLAQSPSQTGWFWVEESRSGPPGMGRILPWNTLLFKGSERDSQDTAVHDYEGFYWVRAVFWTLSGSPVLKLYSFRKQ